MLHDGPPHHSNDAYSYAKRMLEIHSKTYREQYGHNFFCIIPTNIFGEFDNFSLDDGHVIPSLIHKCYLAKKNNSNFVIKGTGKPLRQFIYSHDLAKLILWTLYEYKENDNIILSVPEKDEVSIEHVARLIAEAFELPQNNIIFDKTSADGQFKKTADNSKLNSYLPNFKFTPLNSAINKTVKWFSNNYNNARK